MTVYALPEPCTRIIVHPAHVSTVLMGEGVGTVAHLACPGCPSTAHVPTRPAPPNLPDPLPHPGRTP